MFWGKQTIVSTDQEKINELLRRGIVEIIDEEQLRNRLRSGERLRVKLGIDPTGGKLHIGHAIALLKLRDFQELGHTVVFIVGDATGVVGDTSDKESERPMLTPTEIKENKKTYLNQISKLLNIKKIEVRHNSEWLNSLGYTEIGEQANEFSVADFIARDNIKRRIDAGKRVSLREVLYPLMQGYDSVAINADVELGGQDQRFNLLAGRVLQRHYEQPPQDIIMGDLIEGLDGRKMSKSYGNTVNLDDSPQDMYGKIMSLNDELILRYFTLCTRVPLDQVREIESALKKGENPHTSKMRLAREIVALYHGAQSAQEAEQYFTETFSQKKTPKDMPTTVVAPGTNLADALVSEGILTSKAEFRRLVEQGAVRDLEKNTLVDDSNTKVSTPATLKIGKKRFLRIDMKK